MKILRLSAVIVCALAAAGCGGSDTPNTKAPADKKTGGAAGEMAKAAFGAPAPTEKKTGGTAGDLAKAALAVPAPAEEKSGGSAGNLAKAAIAAPVQADAPKAPAAKQENKTVKLVTPAITSDAGKTYRHPIGFSFWHPSDWKVQDQQDFLLLTPPNQGSNAQGPTEIYLITGESIAGEGITGPTDPQVIEYLDQQVMQLVPFARRQGGAESANMTSGKGAVLNWEGTNPNNNLHILVRSYVGIIGESAAALTGLGDKKLVEKRDAELRKMFASFGIGQGKVDPRLARSWKFMKNVAVTNQSPFETSWSRAQFAGETNTTLTLRADGTWTRRTVSQAIMGASGIWLDTGKQEEVTEGRWAAGDGTLYLMYKDDSWTIYQYRLEGTQLRLAREGKGEVWQSE